VNPHAERERLRKIPQTNPTPPDQSDHMHPSFNPKVPGSRPGRPTSKMFNLLRYRLWTT